MTSFLKQQNRQNKYVGDTACRIKKIITSVRKQFKLGI